MDNFFPPIAGIVDPNNLKKKEVSLEDIQGVLKEIKELLAEINANVIEISSDLNN